MITNDILLKSKSKNYRKINEIKNKNYAKHVNGGNKSSDDKKKTLYENIKETLIMIIDMVKKFIEQNSKSYAISDFIELSPTKQVIVNGKPTEQRLPILEKSSFTYIILYTMMLFVFSIVPAVIFGLTLYYFISLMNIPKWFRKKQFYGDNVSYQNIDGIYNVFGRFYLNDYTFYIIIVILIYMIFLGYISFSSYAKKKDEKYRLYNFRIYTLIGLCVSIITIHFALYFDFIQYIGKLRDKINNTVYNHINFDYIDHLTNLDDNNSKCKEECEMKLPTGNTIKICSCQSSLIELNSIDNLETYIKSILTDLESKVSPTDISEVTIKTFKTYKNNNGVLYYDLILDSIMTFYLLLNFANTKYIINIDKSFLKNRTPLISTINDSTNILYDFTSMKCSPGGGTVQSCLNRDIDGKDNKSTYMSSICDEIQTLVQGIRNDIGSLKNRMGTLTVSVQFFSIILTLIVCIVFYASFMSNFSSSSSSSSNSKK